MIKYIKFTSYLIYSICKVIIQSDFKVMKSDGMRNKHFDNCELFG